MERMRLDPFDLIGIDSDFLSAMKRDHLGHSCHVAEVTENRSAASPASSRFRVLMHVVEVHFVSSFRKPLLLRIPSLTLIVQRRKRSARSVTDLVKTPHQPQSMRVLWTKNSPSGSYFLLISRSRG